MKRIAILGSSGSIGTQALDVIKAHSDQFKLVAMAVGSNIECAIEQVNMFKPAIVSVGSKQLAEELKLHIPSETKVTYGPEGLLEVATHSEVDVLLTAVVGSVGLAPTLAAIKTKKNIAIANKETLVSAGQIVMETAKQNNVSILPVDSEHSAIFQCLQGERIDQVDEITLTASGGSFRDKSRAELKGVTVRDALNHPNWSMGSKITIDSASMMNKGFEVIEAYWLFQIPYDKINVILHQESIIHSMVRFKDQSIMAQLGSPDMRVPIQYALSYPDRIQSHSKRLDLVEVGKLHFRELDFKRYPCLQMAYDAGREGGTMPTVLNAANEIAVSRFLQSEISFLQIENIIYKMLEQHNTINHPSLEEIFETDLWAREVARSII
jgi:1-deoxy-D-xylulose-5-phosphate reductoisomerase